MASQPGDQPVKVVNVDCDRPEKEKDSLYAAERKAVEDLGGELVLLSATTEEEIIRACAGARIILTEGLFTPITRRVLEALPDCWAVGRYGIGVDNIDVEAATDCGIVVFNVADYCVEEVADHAAALVLACARRVVILDRHVRAGGWDKTPLEHPLRRLGRLTLGLVGFGNIGRHMVPRLQGFGMRILATDPYVNPRLAAEAGVELTSLERVLGESDLVSLHTFLTAGTRHLIGAPELRSDEALGVSGQHQPGRSGGRGGADPGPEGRADRRRRFGRDRGGAPGGRQPPQKPGQRRAHAPSGIQLGGVWRGPSPRRDRGPLLPDPGILASLPLQSVGQTQAGIQTQALTRPGQGRRYQFRCPPTQRCG